MTTSPDRRGKRRVQPQLMDEAHLSPKGHRQLSTKSGACGLPRRRPGVRDLALHRLENRDSRRPLSSGWWTLRGRRTEAAQTHSAKGLEASLWSRAPTRERSVDAEARSRRPDRQPKELISRYFAKPSRRTRTVDPILTMQKWSQLVAAGGSGSLRLRRFRDLAFANGCRGLRALCSVSAPPVTTARTDRPGIEPSAQHVRVRSEAIAAGRRGRRVRGGCPPAPLRSRAWRRRL